MKLLYFLTIFGLTMFGTLWGMDFVVPDSHLPTDSSQAISQPPLPAQVKGISVVRDTHRASEPVAHATPHIVYLPPHRRDDMAHLTLPDAHAAVVIDVDSGAVLYDQHATDARAIASLTKLYTAYLVRTSDIDIDAPITITQDMLQVVGSRVGCHTSYQCDGERLHVGEQLTVHDLLAAMLISSANDAAVILAHAVSGSTEDFVDLMNRRARELGLAGVHFCTPNGLEPDEGAEQCVASAMSIAQIARKVIDDELIWSFLHTKEYDIHSVNGEFTHHLEATNRLVVDDDNPLPEMIGAKTGFTPRAGHSVLLAAQHPNHGARVIAVILGDAYRWRDIKELINWTFNAYQWKSHKYKISQK